MSAAGWVFLVITVAVGFIAGYLTKRWTFKFCWRCGSALGQLCPPCSGNTSLRLFPVPLTEHSDRR